mgnify:CR=1 FL=1
MNDSTTCLNRQIANILCDFCQCLKQITSEHTEILSGLLGITDLDEFDLSTISLHFGEATPNQKEIFTFFWKQIRSDYIPEKLEQPKKQQKFEENDTVNQPFFATNHPYNEYIWPQPTLFLDSRINNNTGVLQNWDNIDD